MIFKRINAVFNPECYHGWGINKRFFEGWYFKIIYITLYNKKNNKELFSEKGTSAAIEVAGKYRQLIK